MNEIRTLGARVLPWPMDAHALVNLRATLVNCSRSDADGSSSAAEAVQAAPTDVAEGTPAPAEPVDSLTHFAMLMGEDPTPVRIPKAVFEHCQPVIDLVRAATKQQTKYKYVVRTETGLVGRRAGGRWMPWEGIRVSHLWSLAPNQPIFYDGAVLGSS